MKISFIATVYNEEKSIESFLSSLASQTRKADEIVIVDGGSTDKTVDLIKKSKLKIKLIIRRGNPSLGRNVAIENTPFERIAVSDAGCLLDKNWLANLIKPFEKDNSIDVSSGFYKPKTNSIFEKCLATYTCVMLDRVDPQKFLPSSRSVAFKKSAWKKAGGYPNDLHACEDIIFDLRLKKIGAKFVFIKDAFVYWPQKKNISEASNQFYEYAKGDGEAFFIRQQTPLLYSRYILGFILLLYGVLKPNLLSISMILVLVPSYLAWSVFKNYKYVQNRKAFIYLPQLQITSDIATIYGNIIGFFKRRSYTIPILIYIVITLFSIKYGIPNQNHPFNYNMDEWHQSQAVRAVFTQFSPNVEGAANGSMFHFLFSGLFIAPFVVLGFIDTNLITSSITGISEQQKIFMLLRLNTLFFGVLTLFIVSKIAKLLKISRLYAVILFASTPVWIILSNIFKYDIALTFWITLSTYTYLKFGQNPNYKNYLIASVPTALAFATKISALPLFLVYFFTYFLYFPKNKWITNLQTLFIGIFLYFIIAIFAGIPDIIFGFGNLNEYLGSNLVGNTDKYAIYNTGFPVWWMYWILRILPTVFGHTFFILSVFSFSVLLSRLFKSKLKTQEFKHEALLILSLVIFACSLIQLNLGSTGNRLLVLLPFIVIITAKALTLFSENKNLLFIIRLIIILVIFLQIISSSILIYPRFVPSVNETSSKWILKNIKPKTTIGLENPPIYQTQPDIVLTEFYKKQADESAYTKYEYVITSQEKVLPNVVIIPGKNLHEKFIKNSERKLLINKLYKQGFNVKAEFNPPAVLNLYYIDDLAYDLSGISFSSSLTIFSK